MSKLTNEDFDTFLEGLDYVDNMNKLKKTLTKKEKQKIDRYITYVLQELMIGIFLGLVIFVAIHFVLSLF